MKSQGRRTLLPTRSLLLGIVSKLPGIRFRELREHTGLANGALAYHLNVLEREGMVTVDRQPGKAGVYPSSFDSQDAKTFTFVRQDRSRKILSLLLKVREATHGDLSDTLGVSPSTTSWYLQRLVRAGVLTFSVSGRNTKYSIVSPESVSRLLALYKSTWQDNVVNRFVSAWDQVTV